MNRANDGRFLGILGFLGFLGFRGSPQSSHLANLPFLSLLSLGSLLVLLPLPTSQVKVPIDPRKKAYLGFLSCLTFLGFLRSSSPELAGLAIIAILSSFAIRTRQLSS